MSTNLEFITSASGTETLSLEVQNCFSDKYDVYFGIVGGTGTTTSAQINLRLIDSTGTIITQSEYDCASYQLKSYAAPHDQLLYPNRTQFDIMSYTREPFSGMTFYIYNPYNSSSYTFVTAQSSGNYAGQLIAMKFIGMHKVAEQITGLNVVPNANINPTVKIFGVR